MASDKLSPVFYIARSFNLTEPLESKVCPIKQKFRAAPFLMSFSFEINKDKKDK